MNQRVRLSGDIQGQVSEVRLLLDKKPSALGVGEFARGTRVYRSLDAVRTDVLECALDQLRSRV